MAYLFIIAAVLRELAGRDPHCVATLPGSLAIALLVVRARVARVGR